MQPGVAAADGTNQRQLTTAGVHNRAPVFSLHGDLVLFSGETGNQRIDIATGQVADVPESFFTSPLPSTPGNLSPQTEAYLNRCAASMRWPTLLGGPWH
ncbi:hypothetical protein OHA72_48850 [Dactylosporangium sp. NBC_01737]|uniref:hypothetical protein n=1 Tax=Dactylosporangium sp. NBC_01737 TaxID=2975959 RepID=UPI002E161215|nr:hypothetical protein OHA72_48850 [Dactylosporangium sp. NBC_01737]